MVHVLHYGSIYPGVLVIDTHIEYVGYSISTVVGSRLTRLDCGIPLGNPVTKVRVHIASLVGSWETEPLPLELARTYGREQKKKQPLHSITLRGFVDGHFEEIPKQEKRKVRKHMAFRKVTANIEAWAPPIEGAVLTARKFGEKVLKAKEKGEKDQTLLICELVEPYECRPSDSDDDDAPLENFEPGTTIGASASFLLLELLKYEEVTFRVTYKDKKKLGRGRSVWTGDLELDDEGARLKTPEKLAQVEQAIKNAKSEPASDVDSPGPVSGAESEDIPF